MFTNPIASLRFFFLIAIALTVFGQPMLHAQPDATGWPRVKVPLFQVQGGIGVPGGDFADRFAPNGFAGGGMLYKTRKNLVLGIQGDFLFGGVREDDALDHLRTEDGFLIGIDGGLWNPILYLRGYRFQGTVGYVLPVLQSNPNSGLMVRGGVGFMQHKIYYDVKDRHNLPQISEEMVKGYDRLTNGLVLTEYIGYYLMSPNRLVNFHIGFEFTQGFTQSRRSLDYDTRQPNTANRLDLIYAIKAHWMLPLYRKSVIEQNRMQYR